MKRQKSNPKEIKELATTLAMCVVLACLVAMNFYLAFKPGGAWDQNMAMVLGETVMQGALP